MRTTTHRPGSDGGATGRIGVRPVLAGILAGVGASWLEVVWGPRELVVVAIGCWLFLTLLAWSTLSDFGYDLGRSSQAALVATVAIVGLIGLTGLSPFLGGAVAVTSALHLVTRRLADVRRHRVPSRPRDSDVACTDQWKVDREFARIVADFRKEQP